MQNPYGAVPEALKETRLSLRDIMADMLATKKMEMDLSLAKTKAETDTALVSANLERDRLSNLKDIAQMNEASRHHQAVEQNAADTLSLHKSGQEWEQNTKFPQELQLRRDDLDAQNQVRRSQIRESNARLAAIADERRRQNEVVSAGDFAGRFGAGHMLPLLGVNPDEKRPAWQWNQMAQTLQGFMQQHPAAAILSSGHRIKSEIENLSAQYNTPGLAPQAKENLKAQIGKKIYQLNFVDEMIMQTKEPDTTKVAETARKAWAENPQLQTQFGDKYDDFLTAFSNDLKATRSHFKKDLTSMKFSLATRDIDPDYLTTMQTAKQTIDTLADSKQATLIANGTKRRLEEGDLAGAYKYQTDWARHLQITKSSPHPGRKSSDRGNSGYGSIFDSNQPLM